MPVVQKYKYSDYQPQFTTQDEWTNVKYVIEVLRPFRYWTLWMSELHSVTLHHIIPVQNDMFNHTDGVIHALAKIKTLWNEDSIFTVNLAPQNLPRYYAEVTAMTGMRLISAHIIDSFRKLLSFRR
jgi:hypothetical protein